MRIKRVSLWHVPLTSHATYHMAAGKTCATVETAILRVETGSGVIGWGEVCPIPHYLPAFARGVASVLQELAPALIGADPVGAEALITKLDALLPGHAYAKSALDTAFWDITGKVARLPLYTLLGGRQAGKLPLYHSITCVEPDTMAEIAREALETGISQFQAKLGASGDWLQDVERLRAVRGAVGEGPLVYGDWNCGASSLHATRVGRMVNDLDVMLEQPCATIEQCARVRQATGLPMKLDENAHDTESLLEGHRLGCLDAVALKLSKFGGLTHTRRARDLCLHLGVKMCVEDTWGSDITTTAALHLAASTNPSWLLNTCDLSGYVSPRIAPDAPSRQQGFISPPEYHGLGITPDLELLGQPDLIVD